MGVFAGSSVAVTSIHPSALSSAAPCWRGAHPTTRLSKSVNAKPATPMIVSATVHVFSVCCTVMLKNSLMSQNPESFTCESTNEPAPVASTSSSALVPEVAIAIGATIPALVVIATVAEPVATRISAAMVQASRSGEACDPRATSAIALPTPLSSSTLLKPPPAPITRRIVAVGARQSFANLRICTRVKCCRYPSDQKENSNAKSSATIGLPMKSTPARNLLALSSATSAALAQIIRITGSSTVRSEIPKLGMCSAMPPLPPANCAAIGLSGGS